MANSQTATAGQQIVDELTSANNTLVARSASALDQAVAGVLADFLFNYETGTDIPECPNCDSGYPCSHAEETYHERCGEAVTECSCIKPYLTLARVYLGS